jgi:hypothetical protein
MQKRSLSRRAFFLILVGGMLTGMGNGSVFGAALLCFLGRGKFSDWGGLWPISFDPTTFAGCLDWCMIVFGLAYVVILAVALTRHGAIEQSDTAAQH